MLSYVDLETYILLSRKRLTQIIMCFEQAPLDRVRCMCQLRLERENENTHDLTKLLAGLPQSLKKAKNVTKTYSLCFQYVQIVVYNPFHFLLQNVFNLNLCDLCSEDHQDVVASGHQKSSLIKREGTFSKIHMVE